MEDTYEMLEARRLLAEGKYEEALAELDKPYLSQRNAEWYFLRAEIENKLERYYDSLKSLERAIELDPKNKAYKQRQKQYRKELKNAVGSAEKAKSDSKCRDNCGECCGELCCAGLCECICDGMGG